MFFRRRPLGSSGKGANLTFSFKELVDVPGLDCKESTADVGRESESSKDVSRAGRCSVFICDGGSELERIRDPLVSRIPLRPL